MRVYQSLNCTLLESFLLQTQVDWRYLRAGIGGLLLLAAGMLGAPAQAAPEAESRAQVSVEFNGWAQAHEARVSLLGRIVGECPRGFAVVGEQYFPRALGKIELQLAYRCH